VKLTPFSFAVPAAALLLLGASAGAAKERPSKYAAEPAKGGSDESFRAIVSPLLLTRCSPCHAPGGKMYASLPFDKAETVRSHAPGVLKRLKGDDKDTVQGWLDGK
jgi:hypothetical protein